MPTSVGGLGVAAARHAEGGDLRVLQVEPGDLAEEGLVLGVAERIAALDVVDAERVEALGDQELVLKAQADPQRLRAVTQRRVVSKNSRTFGCHFCTNNERTKRRRITRKEARKKALKPVCPRADGLPSDAIGRLRARCRIQRR